MKRIQRLSIVLHLALICMMPGGVLSAQNLRVESVSAEQFDLSASKDSRRDNNGEFCALVKVSFARSGAEFEGNVIGNVDYKAGEYWVYMSKGTKFLKIKHPDFGSQMIYFDKSRTGASEPELPYGLVGPLQSKNTYLIKTSWLGSASGPKEQKVTCKIDPPAGVTLMVDSQAYPVTNGAAEIMLAPGDHYYAVFASGYRPESSMFKVYENSLNKQTIILDRESGSASVASVPPASSSTLPPATSNPVPSQPSSMSPADIERERISDMFEMVYVEGGTFSMGALPNDSDAFDDEKPSHSVTLSSYYIGKYEVTQKQWEAIMGSNPSFHKGDGHPVEFVSWNDIQEFLRRLNAKTGKTYRLPTEAEWEYAARGGRYGGSSLYSGGDDIDAVAWYDGNSEEWTHPVGTKSPNALGIYDMSGNVYEYCSDWYDAEYYSKSPSVNPQGPSSGAFRVRRGGWRFSTAGDCRVSYRSNFCDPDGGYSNTGIRLVLPASEP